MASVYRLARPNHNGKATLRDEFEAVSKMRGKMHDELIYPDSPPLFTPIVKAYNDLAGAELTYQELKAYRDMTNTNIDGFDIGLLKDIDFVKKLISNGRTVKQTLEAFGYGTSHGTS